MGEKAEVSRHGNVEPPDPEERSAFDVAEDDIEAGIRGERPRRHDLLRKGHAELRGESLLVVPDVESVEAHLLAVADVSSPLERLDHELGAVDALVVPGETDVVGFAELALGCGDSGGELGSIEARAHDG